MTDVILLTENNDFFGQTRKAWVPMSGEKLQSEIENAGFRVQRMPLHRFVNAVEIPRNTVIFTAFSQKRNVRRYILDAVHYADRENLIVPSIDLLLCHEDKGYQELFKRKRGIPSLKALYFSTPDEVQDYKIDFPVVLKAVEGSNAKNVFLVQNEKELHALLKKYREIRCADRIDYFRRKFLRKKQYDEYPEHNDKIDAEQWKHYITRHHNFVLQEFVPGLEYDFRVLALQNKFYVMKRHTHKNDFRASGTKKFDFDFDLNPELLNFAQDIFLKADTPFLSMDIVEKDRSYFVIEFQALHFGTAVLKKSKGFWQYKKNGWQFIEAVSEIEKELARSFVNYIQERNF